MDGNKPYPVRSLDVAAQDPGHPKGVELTPEQERALQAVKEASMLRRTIEQRQRRGY